MALYSSVDDSVLHRIQKLVSTGQILQAEVLCKQHLESSPDDAVLLLVTAQMYDATHQSDLAEQHFARAAVVEESNPRGFWHYCAWLQANGRSQDVIEKANDGLSRFPSDLILLSAKFKAGGDDADVAGGIAALEAAIEAEASAQVLSDTLNILSPLFQSFGESSLVERLISKLVSLDPGNVENQRCLAFTSLYNDEIGPEALVSIHREFGAVLENSVAPRWPQFNNNRNPDRRIRIGYLSRDFRSHVVANFTLGWMKHHNPEEVETFLYIANRPDEITERFIAAADKHRFIDDLSPLGVAEKIKSDKIDILVDLAGHTTGSLTSMLALRPAPVQVSYVGYASTTGLTRIDYRMIDPVSDPVGSESLATEAPFRLDRCFLCYDRINPLPEISQELPERPTAGTFNNLMKVSDSTLKAWARIHQLHNEVRLIAKCHLPTSEPLRRFKEAKMKRVIEEAGGDPVRFELLPYIFDYEESQQAYKLLDISLDPFPYSGTTSTFESLTMGVPVVTLQGEDHRSRVSSSILHHLGMSDLVATSVEDYAVKAVELLNNRGQVHAARAELRGKVLVSDTCNPQSHAEAIEAAFREMWETWCENPD